MRAKTIELHNRIKLEFQKLSNKKEFGVQKYTNDWIFNKLANDFYKSPITIEDIVFNRTKEYKKPKA